MSNIQKNQPLAKLRVKSVKPNTNTKPTKYSKSGANIYNIEEEEPKSMFDKYYENKIRSKSPITNNRQDDINYNYNYEESENFQKCFNNDNNIDNDNNNNNDNINENNDKGDEIENLIK